MCKSLYFFFFLNLFKKNNDIRHFLLCLILKILVKVLKIKNKNKFVKKKLKYILFSFKENRDKNIKML